MNGRLYDPYLGRMLSPDNFVQNPGYSQNFNRYSYAYNNPLRYTDPDGEWVHIAVGAIIGGVINLATNWDNIDGFWEGLAAFGVGAGSGALTAATGGASLGVQAGVAIGTGAIMAGTNNIIAQTGQNGTSFSGHVDWNQVGFNSVVGGFAGVAGYGAGKWASSNIGGVVVNGLHISSNSIIGGAITGGVGGAVGGYAGGFTGGVLMTGDLSAANEAGFNGAWIGGSIGTSVGAANGYLIAKRRGLNIWNGRPKKSVVIGGPQSRVNKYAKLLDSETIENNSIQNWPDDMPAYIGKDIPNPEALDFNQVWMEQVIKAEYYIYDAGRYGYSPFYNGVEMFTIQNNNYGRVYKVTYIRTIRILIIYK